MFRLLGHQLVKSTSSSDLYLDYNASSPCADSVKKWAQGDFFFANPSSLHSAGIKSRQFIDESREYLLRTFSLEKTHDIFFHSGATEGINTIIKGVASYNNLVRRRKNFFLYNNSDHSSVVNQKSTLELMGTTAISFPSDKQGMCAFDGESLPDLGIINYTWVNNETGIIGNLDWPQKIRKSSEVLIHVDAVQAVGKIENFTKLKPEIDFYTFSGHKFGAQKGVGFSFVKKELKFLPLLNGGGQQNNLRSGTENVPGIVSLKLALEELISGYDYKNNYQAKDDFEARLSRLLNSKGEIVGLDASRNSNTICFIIYGKKADILLTAFDLAQMQVSSGAACSSGSLLPSRVLVNMGYSVSDAKSAIRISFSPYFSLEQVSSYFSQVERVVSRFI